MRFLKKTLQYLIVLEGGKRLLTLFLISVPAGIAASFVAPTWSIYDWLKSFEVGNTDFWYNWTLGTSGFTFWIGLLILFILIIFTTSVVSSIVSRSLRVGVFKTDRIMDEFNESFFPALYAILFYLVIFLLAKTILALFLVLWQTLSFVALSATLSVITMIIILFATSLMLSFTTMFLPIMSINGLNAKDAFVSSVQKCGARAHKILPAIIIPVVAVLLIGNLIGMFEIPLLSEIVDSILYSLLFVYLITFTMVSYYEIEQIKREDYPREYFFRNKR